MGIIDNATIGGYNSDSKHRIRRTHMSDSSANSTATLEPIAPAEERDQDSLADGAAAAGAPERLDNPIERIDLGTPDTFIPESVDQLLAHSRRYPLLTPAQAIDLAQRIERGDLQR